VLKKSGGFTLIEAMITVAIMGILLAGISSMIVTSFKTWNIVTSRIRMEAEARTAVTFLSKIVRASQDTTIKISRLDSSQPCNSYISGQPMEQIYFTAVNACGCNSGGNLVTVASNGGDFAMYQDDRSLIIKYPNPPASLDPSIEESYTYNYRTICADVDSFMVGYDDSTSMKSISVSLRLSEKISNNKINEYMIKQRIVLQHHYSSGYYGNNP
jgi:prepilin-type N-terminal cleavage/methylation domain-containing protein